MRDQPLKPIDAAVYWVEYAIRNRGLDHFRSASLDLPWYKLYMWDVAVFLTIVTAGLSFAFYKVAKKVLRLHEPSTKQKVQWGPPVSYKNNL